MAGGNTQKSSSKFSGEEFSRIRAAAEKTKMTVSVFIREMALRGKVTGRVSEEAAGRTDVSFEDVRYSSNIH